MLNLTALFQSWNLSTANADEGAAVLPGLGRLYVRRTRASLLLDDARVPDSDAEAFLRQAQTLPHCAAARTANGNAVLHFIYASPQDETAAFEQTLTAARALLGQADE